MLALISQAVEILIITWPISSHGWYTPFSRIKGIHSRLLYRKPDIAKETTAKTESIITPGRKRTLSACGGSGTFLIRLRWQPIRVRSCTSKKFLDLMISLSAFAFNVVTTKRATRRQPFAFKLNSNLLVIVRINLLDCTVFSDVEVCELNASLV